MCVFVYVCVCICVCVFLYPLLQLFRCNAHVGLTVLHRESVSHSLLESGWQYNLKYQHNILRRPLAGLALWKLLANVYSKLNLAFSGELSWTCPIFNLSTSQPAREAPLSKLLPRPLQSTFFNIKSPDWYPKIRRVNISWTGIFEKSENELKYREFFHF